MQTPTMSPEFMSAAANAGSGVANAVTSVINTNKTIRANKEMAKYAYSQDLEMWNRQNQYNSPAAQMERLKAANLNPNLMYGSGNVGNASTMPKYQAPKLDYSYQAPNFGKTISAYFDVKTQQATIDNINARTKQAEQLTINASIEQAIKSLEKEIRDQKVKAGQMELNWKPEMLYQKWRTSDETIKRIVAGRQLNESQKQVADANAKQINALTQLKVNLAMENILTQQANRTLIPAKKNLMEKQLEAITSTIALQSAQIGKIGVDTQLQQKNVNWYAYNQILKGLNTWGTFRGQNLNFLKGVIPNFGQLNPPQLRTTRGWNRR